MEDTKLAQRAAELYPDSPYLQKEWMRAVGVVRSTLGGWLIERNHSLAKLAEYVRIQ